ncbi:hypothetical protein J1614_008348 [Plenodomus biglobosus]|nr:hypothetical protein J1614_008348 [Plenodomus biglobosus]
MPRDSPSPTPRLRTSEGHLYQECLDACIAGIEGIPVDKRQAVGRSALTTNNNIDLATPLTNTRDITVSESAKSEQNTIASASGALPLGLSLCEQLNSIADSPQSSAEAMKHSKYASQHGVPPQRSKSMQPQGSQATPPHLRRAVPQQAQAPPTFAYALPARGSQDVRNNLAVQPAADAGTMKLKKKAVKIVGPATPSAAAPKPSLAPLTASSLAPGPVVASLKEAESFVAPAPADPMPTIRSAPSKIDIPQQSNPAGDSLESVYLRLMTPSAKSTPQAAKAVSPTRPDKDMFSFGTRPSEVDVGKKLLGNLLVKAPTQPAQSEHEQPTTAKISQQEPSTKVEDKKTLGKPHSLLEEELESQYMRKACEYVDALPGSKGTSAFTFRIVANKLRSSYAPTLQTSSEENEALKARYAFAVVKYVKGLEKGGLELTISFVKQILKDNDGDLLQLCAKLMEHKHIAVDNLEETIGLCKKILDILPKSEPNEAPRTFKTTVQTAAWTTDAGLQSKPLLEDPVDNMSAWPNQEKRDYSAGFRTCILRGVSGMKTVNELQALVWGGKLECISMTEGANFGMVRFLTVDGCQKYYKATQNGIEIPGSDRDKKTIVLVERTEGPNSINDVMRACAEGDASRCIRAIGADDTWNDMLLMKLAHGNEKVKRELDTIKHGKTSRGFEYVEFRFANIYHALSFKRELEMDQDWEHCTISYASDPCEVAHGVHYDDAE